MAKTASTPFTIGFNFEAHTKFLQRRFARIWPLYAVMTLLAVIAVKSGAGPQFRMPSGNFELAVLANLAMIQSWGVSDSILGPGWSISTELAAYILFPGILVITVFCRRRTALLVGLGCALLLSALAILPKELTGVIKYWGPLDMPESRNYSAISRCILEFTLGILAWRVGVHPKVRQLSSKFALSEILACLLLGLLALRGTDIAYALLIPVFIASVSSDESHVARLLGRNPIHWLGVISYSLYLTHMFLWILRDRLSSTLLKAHVPHAWSVAYAAGLIVLFPMAAAAHYGIEKPGRQALRRWMDRRPPAPINPNLAAP